MTNEWAQKNSATLDGPVPEITIVDYGMGNIYSVVKAFEKYGAKVKLSADQDELAAAQALVLPGDGAFTAAIKNLKQREIFDTIKKHLFDDRWLFGICLGFQLLFDESEEFGNTQGFGFFPGTVKRFQGDFSIPHMGWNQTIFQEEHSILQNVPSPGNFYFIHSYYAICENKSDELGICNYANDFSAIAARGKVFATQFHPEKSHEDGMKLIKNFVHCVSQSLDTK